ncbi:hypothetical protein CMV_009944 [Castanea mollissima]|uniref:Uncharacterized protein n=1 Tax=Castanea mollissima TaxID=60419 RepID=A0A8J4RJ35_9ROSI|nr:hypothetical protein CMV_009944 [Castanea mollissima]
MQYCHVAAENYINFGICALMMIVFDTNLKLDVKRMLDPNAHHERSIVIFYNIQVCVIKGCGTQKMAFIIFEKIRRDGLTVEVEIPKTIDNGIPVLLKPMFNHKDLEWFQ